MLNKTVAFNIETMKAVSHPCRLQILIELEEGPKTVNQLRNIFPAFDANVSQHLGVLRNGGIVDYIQNGTQRIYYLSRPGFGAKIINLLRAEEPPVRLTKTDVAACAG